MEAVMIKPCLGKTKKRIKNTSSTPKNKRTPSTVTVKISHIISADKPTVQSKGERVQARAKTSPSTITLITTIVKLKGSQSPKLIPTSKKATKPNNGL